MLAAQNRGKIEIDRASRRRGIECPRRFIRKNTRARLRSLDIDRRG
jgi:hypothetical protein